MNEANNSSIYNTASEMNTRHVNILDDREIKKNENYMASNGMRTKFISIELSVKS